MKTNKIRNVAKEICVAEQMIAYNIAFRSHISFGDEFNNIKSGVEKSEKLMKIRDIGLKNYRDSYDYKPGKYNEDAIFVALNQGLEEYLNNPFIAGDYEQVGKAFPIPYN